MQSEFDFINNIKSRYGLFKIGDDAAVLPKDSETDLVISTDLLVEDIDFRMKWTKPEFIGHKALAVSVSDIAAMGAKPNYALLSIGVPQSIWKTDFLDKFYDGYFQLAKKFAVEIIGGDVSKTPDKIVIDSIVMGQVSKGKAILRSTAQVGDLIYVTGELGGASFGLNLLENGVRYKDSTPRWQRKLLLQQLQPVSNKDGRDFANFATSMIDLSDGLSSDLMHICEASEVGAKIYSDKIPIHRELKQLPSNKIKNYLSDEEEILEFALNGGEDFELLFTINPEKALELDRSPYSPIGIITDKKRTIELANSDGSMEILKAKGFQHFR